MTDKEYIESLYSQVDRLESRLKKMEGNLSMLMSACRVISTELQLLKKLIHEQRPPDGGP